MKHSKEEADRIRHEILYKPEPNCIWDSWPRWFQVVVVVAMVIYFGGGAIAFMVGMSRLP